MIHLRRLIIELSIADEFCAAHAHELSQKYRQFEVVEIYQ